MAISLVTDEVAEILKYADYLLSQVNDDIENPDIVLRWTSTSVGRTSFFVINQTNGRTQHVLYNLVEFNAVGKTKKKLRTAFENIGDLPKTTKWTVLEIIAAVCIAAIPAFWVFAEVVTINQADSFLLSYVLLCIMTIYTVIRLNLKN